MTTKNLTAIRAAESESDDDDFGKLMFRFTAANERLKLAAHALARGEDLVAKAQAHLAEAEKARSYSEEYGLEDPESAGRALERLRDEAEAAQECAEHVRKLREYWARKHPEQTL